MEAKSKGGKEQTLQILGILLFHPQNVSTYQLSRNLIRQENENLIYTGASGEVFQVLFSNFPMT